MRTQVNLLHNARQNTVKMNIKTMGKKHLRQSTTHATFQVSHQDGKIKSVTSRGPPLEYTSRGLHLECHIKMAQFEVSHQEGHI